ncbi:collagen-like triple helix repeat-containing protein [Enterococcus faecalis]
MKAKYVQPNDEIQHTDHNDLVDDTKELEAKLSQIPAGPKGEKGDPGSNGKDGAPGAKGDDGLGIKALEFTKDSNGQIVSGVMTMTDDTTLPISITIKKAEEV